jgi:uroporphyrinogen decarboxylase
LPAHRFIQALLKQPVDRVPVWFMRQAGRYLPEYLATRKQAGSFKTLCQTPDLACEVTLQPLRRFDLDAAILFSDILTVPDAMGLGMEIVEKFGPRFERTVRSQADVDQLIMPEPEDQLGYVMDAVRLIRKELDNKVPLIGFAGSPWTVATYMVEGQGTKTFSVIKKMLYSDPALLHQILSKVTEATISYLNAQIAAGAQAIMIFDSWGGVLGPGIYQEFSLAYMQQIVAGLKTETAEGKVPVILYGKQTHFWLEDIANSGCDAVGLDWTISMQDAKRRVGDKVALQGNMDPAVLYAQPEVIQKTVNSILTGVAEQPGFVFNLGHGLMPDIPFDSVEVAVNAAHDFQMEGQI